MCGRYDNVIARHAMQDLFRVARLPDSNFPPRYNVAPAQDVPIVRTGPDGTREVVMARWGLIPFWKRAKPPNAFINARAETVHQMSMFRHAFARRRCLIPATGFRVAAACLGQAALALHHEGFGAVRVCGPVGVREALR